MYVLFVKLVYEKYNNCANLEISLYYSKSGHLHPLPATDSRFFHAASG